MTRIRSSGPAKLIFFGICAMIFFAGGCGGGNPPPVSQPPKPAGQSSTTVSSGTFGDLVLKIGRIPFTNATEMMIKHEALLKYLQSELGVKEVRLILANDYHGILNKLIKGEIDIGWMGSLSYAEVKDSVKLKPLVKPVRLSLIHI